MSDSLWPHGLQHARPLCPSPTPRVYSNSCPLSQWCHPTISYSVIPFSSNLQSFPAPGSFPVSQLFASGGQSIGVSAPASVLPVNFPGLISQESKRGLLHCRQILYQLSYEGSPKSKLSWNQMKLVAPVKVKSSTATCGYWLPYWIVLSCGISMTTEGSTEQWRLRATMMMMC